ncbi:MAG: alpha/beta fold hydrolase [Burkholderiales bacterium]|jgi:homoserine O-acetyltransferase
MRSQSTFIHALALSVAASLAASSHAAEPAVREGDHVVRDFVFASGERLPEVRLHYRSLGAPVRDAQGVVRNAVLLLHGTGGTGAQFLQPQFAAEMFGPGQPLDAATHFVVMPDALGHGKSSKPSDGLRQKFPRYGYADMVGLQHRLLTESLGVAHLRVILGTSMGGMHAWMWGYTHPTFMDALVPLASAPTAIVGRNRIWRKALMDSIRDDPGFAGGEYAEPPREGLRAAVRLLVLMGAAPIQWQEDYPTREAADAFLEAQLERRMPTAEANDMLYQLDASRDYDPSKHLEAIVAPVLAINSADDLINPPELGLMEALLPRVARCRYVLVPASGLTRGHGTHTWAALWKQELVSFLAAPPVGRITDAAEEVRRLERELVAAIGSRDLAAYDRLVDDAYVALRGTGDQTKAQVMETYRAGRLAYRGLDIADVEVRLLGETAVVSARTLGTRVEQGRETPNRVRYLRVWAKRDGAWRAVLQMAVPLPPSP